MKMLFPARSDLLRWWISAAQWLGSAASFLKRDRVTSNWDAALYKFINLTERLNLQIRMEAFDCINHS
jgi:hypothetical protein